MRINPSDTAALLQSADKILILTHENPDGDALGSAYALCRGLLYLGKNVRVHVESLPKIDSFMADGLCETAFDAQTIVAVDTADAALLGVAGTALSKQTPVDLCIDHHFSNTNYARRTLLDASAAATAEIIYDLLTALRVPVDPVIADCLYVGVATDTGCFRYSNTTARTFEIAAALTRAGARVATLNHLHFETKSRAAAKLEQAAIAGMTFFENDTIAVMPITYDMFRAADAFEAEISEFASLPRRIEGVLVGITLKEKQPGEFRVSIRTNEPADASAIASILGGGGHVRAAGCTIRDTADGAIRTAVAAATTVLRSEGLL